MKITVDKAEILNIIAANRAEHRKIFLEALDGYRRKAVELLEQRIREVKDGKFVTYVSMTQPEDHTRDYDRVLKMLNQHQGNTVDLLEQDFAMYVQDDWEWKHQFLTSNSGYSGTAAAALAAVEAAREEGT